MICTLILMKKFRRIRPTDGSMGLLYNEWIYADKAVILVIMFLNVNGSAVINFIKLSMSYSSMPRGGGIGKYWKINVKKNANILFSCLSFISFLHFNSIHWVIDVDPTVRWKLLIRNLDLFYVLISDFSFSSSFLKSFWKKEKV